MHMLINQISSDYKQYERSSVMKQLAQYTHENAYIGQTSSATFKEVCELIDEIKLPKAAHLLDAGCGNGAFTFLIAQHYGFSLRGVDISSEVIHVAQKRAQLAG